LEDANAALAAINDEDVVLTIEYDVSVMGKLSLGLKPWPNGTGTFVF